MQFFVFLRIFCSRVRRTVSVSLAFGAVILMTSGAAPAAQTGYWCFIPLVEILGPGAIMQKPFGRNWIANPRGPWTSMSIRCNSSF